MDACSHSPIAAASCRGLDFPEFTSDSESQDTGSEDSNLSEQLANWAVRFSIPLSATGALLNVLQQYHPSLPCDPRTLLKTPVTCKVRGLSDGGEYCHAGLANGIQALVKDNVGILPSSQLLELQLNIDGLPLFKSSSTSLWPMDK